MVDDFLMIEGIKIKEKIFKQLVDYPQIKDSVNFIDFRNNLCASCSDDATIVVYNYGSYR
jgi:hypothetical protein